jgi:serine O-acetyltransferase
MVKKLNSAIYHNSLPPATKFSPDIRLGHHGFGTVIHSNVTIGKRVKIWHNVTIAVHAHTGSDQGIVIEDDVNIGANSVIIASGEKSLRIGRGARIGAGAVVVDDVAPGTTVVGPAARPIGRQASSAHDGDGERLTG